MNVTLCIINHHLILLLWDTREALYISYTYLVLNIFLIILIHTFLYLFIYFYIFGLFLILNKLRFTTFRNQNFLGLVS